jgi:hypothetical protein
LTGSWADIMTWARASTRAEPPMSFFINLMPAAVLMSRPREGLGSGVRGGA